MELPPPLRHAVDRMLDGVSRSDIAAATAVLSRRYRDETRGVYIANEHAALAYLAARLPATYAAVRASFTAVRHALPEFLPTTALDVGAGPGTALWAAADCWPGIIDVLLIEASPLFRAYGERLSAQARPPHVVWRTGDATVETIDSPPRNLVTLAYVLGELAPDGQRNLVAKLWGLTADLLVIVEPGTPAGWRRILSARDALIASGAHIVAPCPHAHTCPLIPPDWCHFAQRVARSRIHRLAKNADVPWEDEKFIYLGVSRQPATTAAARVIARPRKASGRVTLKLCRPDGSAAERLISRRDGALFKQAARAAWGQSLDE